MTRLQAQLAASQEQLDKSLEWHRKSEVAIHELNGQIKLLNWLVEQEQADEDDELGDDLDD